jgi:ribosomal-protein-alanine N-acetyltransferase
MAQIADAAPRIEGRRVALYQPLPAHENACIALNRLSADHYEGWVAPPVTKEQYQAYLERAALPNSCCSMIIRRADGALMGAINLSQIIRGPLQSAFMGYHIGAPFARQGYASEAVTLALDLAFSTLELHRVEANIQPGNTPSIALVRRLGFTREGFSERYLYIAGAWRDHERWALLAENWLARNRAAP